MLLWGARIIHQQSSLTSTKCLQIFKFWKRKKERKYLYQTKSKERKFKIYNVCLHWNSGSTLGNLSIQPYSSLVLQIFLNLKIYFLYKCTIHGVFPLFFWWQDFGEFVRKSEPAEGVRFPFLNVFLTS